MTIRLPPERKNGITDKILHLLKKERQLVIPKDVHEYGPYVIVQARYQGFFECLFHRKSSDQTPQERILAEAKAEVEKWMIDPVGKKNLF